MTVTMQRASASAGSPAHAAPAPTVPSSSHPHGAQGGGPSTRPALRPATDFCLPAAYIQQSEPYTHDDFIQHDAAGRPVEYWNAERISSSAKYQYHVYAWAAAIVRTCGLRSVLDVGCGPGTKLASLIAPVCADIEGVDQPSAVRAARAQGAPGRYSEVDLENPGATAAWRTFDLILCVDVVEHLLDPDPAMELLQRFAQPRSLLLFSTPDRERFRGRGCMRSDKREHVREWGHAEFKRFLSSRGLRPAASRLFPVDNAAISGAMRRAEWKFRLHLADTSPLACQAVLCTVDAKR